MLVNGRDEANCTKTCRQSHASRYLAASAADEDPQAAFLCDLLRKSRYLSKSLETGIAPKRVELRNGESKTKSNRALRGQPLQGSEGSVPIPHPGKRDRLVIRELPGQLDDPLSFVASSNPPVSVPKVTSNRSAERHFDEMPTNRQGGWHSGTPV